MVHVKQCYQIGQKLVENTDIENIKCDILDDFHTEWSLSFFEIFVQGSY